MCNLVYSQKMVKMVEAGKSYFLANVLRKQGEHSFWAVKTSMICEWAQIENAVTEPTNTTPKKSLAEALIFPSVSSIVTILYRKYM